MDGTLSYTGRDVIDIRRALVDRVPKLTDKWKDFSESDLGMVIIELIAGAQDMQNFYFDAQAFETFLDTAVQPKNVYSLLRAMNYRIPLVGSAKGVVRLEYKDSLERDIYVPKYYQFLCSRNNNIRYLASEAIYTSTVNGVVDIPVFEGEYREKSVTREQLSTNLTSAGTVSRRIYLGSENVADGSVEIYQEGCIWEQVDDALLMYEGGYYYSTHVDNTGEVYILMSVNFMDLIPTNPSEKVIIKYAISKGVAGTVKANQIDSILSPTEGNIHPVDLKYIGNPEDTYGASDIPDINTLKILGRRNAQNMGRYITLGDYENGVASEPYVKYCVVKDWKTPEYVSEPYVVKVWAVDHLGNSLGSADKTTLRNKFRSKGVTAVDVQVVDTNIVEFDIHVQIILRNTSTEESKKICNIVRDKINEYYNVEAISYGQRVSLSILHSRIYTMSPYIKDVRVITPDMDIDVGETEFPKLRNITVDVVKSFE